MILSIFLDFVSCHLIQIYLYQCSRRNWFCIILCHLHCLWIWYILSYTFSALLIHVSSVWIYVVSRFCPSSEPCGHPSCLAKTLTLDTVRKLSNQTYSYLPCLLVHLTYLPCLLVPLTCAISSHFQWPLGGGEELLESQWRANLLASFSCTLFSWSGWNLIQLWSSLNWTSWYIILHRSEI